MTEQQRTLTRDSSACASRTRENAELNRQDNH